MIIVAIDDSGDPGFKFARGSSQYFCIAAVYFETKEDAAKMIEVINGLRKKFHLKSGQEFKFHKASMKTRKMFLEEINRYKFRAEISIVDKAKLGRWENIVHPKDFYNGIIASTLARIDVGADKMTIRIDGVRGKSHFKDTKSFLRKSLRVGTVGPISIIDSKSDSLIQLADMVASAAAFDAKNRKDKMLELIKKHIEVITK